MKGYRFKRVYWLLFIIPFALVPLLNISTRTYSNYPAGEITRIQGDANIIAIVISLVSALLILLYYFYETRIRRWTRLSRHFLPVSLFAVFLLFFYWKMAFYNQLIKVNITDKKPEIQLISAKHYYEYPEGHELHGYCLVLSDSFGFIDIKKEKVDLLPGNFCKIELIKGDLGYFYTR